MAKKKKVTKAPEVKVTVESLKSGCDLLGIEAPKKKKGESADSYMEKITRALQAELASDAT